MATTTISFKTAHSKRETRSILLEALKAQKDFAYSRFMKFSQECESFEQKYQMDSQQFLQQFEAGTLGDDEQWFDWYAVVRGRTVWNNKYQILRDVSWNE